MNQAQELHREAMQLAHEAFVAQNGGEPKRFLELSKMALEKERAAAWLLFDQLDAEPTRSILFRSAAHLAFNCGFMRETEQLIAAALAGNPPAEIIQELRQLSKSVLAAFDQAA